MKIKSISFENYKAFSEKQTIEIKPITLLIGKNSSGKSSIAKLFTLLENSLSGNINEPLLFTNNNVELGSDFTDLVYGGRPSIPISFSIIFENDIGIKVSILQEIGKFDLTIYEWTFESNKNNISLKYSPDGFYYDTYEKRYVCKFSGIIPCEIWNEKGINIASDFQFDNKINVDYIGPFRVLPKRQFYLTGQINYTKTGVKGENAYPILGVSKILKNDLFQKVGDWYKKHFDGWELIVDDTKKPFIQILLKKENTVVNIVDVGQGMKQVLPLVVRANIGNPKSITILEQPELHLHPAAHADLAELLAKSAIENNQSFIIETHSENVLLRLRKLTIENSFGFTNEDVAIYWIDDSEKEGQQLNRITIDKDAILSDWPSDVFNENIFEILEIQKALKKRK